MHYYSHHIGDFIKDTSNLDDHHCMTYQRLLWRYYLDEKPISGTLDDIAFDVKSDEKTVGRLLRHYFTQDGEVWRHKRVEEEIASYHAKAEKARASANARWVNSGARKAAEKSDGNADGLRPHEEDGAVASKSDANQEPITKNQVDNPLPPAVPAEGGGEVVPKRLKPEAGGAGKRFDEFWAAWPKSERKQDKAKCFAKWKRDNLDLLADTILADIALKRKTQKWQADAGKYIEAPFVYLNGKRWEDGVEPQEQGQGAISGGDWWDTRSGVEKRARELGVFAYGERTVDEQGRTITWQLYKNIVIKAARAAGEKF